MRNRIKAHIPAASVAPPSQIEENMTKAAALQINHPEFAARI
jgi:hypothetical protein